MPLACMGLVAPVLLSIWTTMRTKAAGESPEAVKGSVMDRVDIITGMFLFLVFHHG